MANVTNNYIFVSDSREDKNNPGLLYDAIVKSLIDRGVKDKFEVKKINIFGLDSNTSIIKVFPSNTVYANIKTSDLKNFLDCITQGKTCNEFVYKNNNTEICGTSEPMYHKQYRVVLKNSGLINPENIEDYIARNGYKGLVKSLSELDKDGIIEEMKISGLRGRGGGGFPTWLKWNFTKNVENPVKYIVCNADEGDPGAYMDRSILEGDPHAIVEGMAIAAVSVGATSGFVYCRAEYPLAIKRLEKAINDAKEYGFLGNNILGTEFSFNLEIRLGAGAFVCGEETALLASVEGERGMPRPRPPFPAVKGLWGKPTVINNVETFANVPVIICNGGKWYSKIGTEKSKGTKVFALTGKVLNSGLVEVPMGTTIREIIFDVGGGMYSEKPFKAAQTGGPSGGVIPQKYIDTPIGYESLMELGSIMGSGGLIVMDEADCMIDVSKFYLQFTVDESCGKCAPCRIGGKQLLSLLEKVSMGAGKNSTVEIMSKISDAMKKASLCGLGQTAPNPVLSTLKYFADEYKAHIENKKCPAGVCKDLVTYKISNTKCIGCTLCVKKCPVNCISGTVKNPHEINQPKCIKCGECFKVCKFNAVIKS